MNFQLSLPYAADSDLHVIEGLALNGTPIFQRPGDWRFLPVDMYTLLQGTIERCLATQQPDGSYMVSPTIFGPGMFSKKDSIPYSQISKWTERDYPGGVLNEVSGYVKNLMDWFPQSLLLRAIDDKIWELGACSSGVHETESCYGTLQDTAPFFAPFFPDATAFMFAAGVNYDPVSFQMQVVPSRITGGAPLYGSPETAGRIYPEMLIDRYKILQVMRYKKAVISDTRRYFGEGFGNSTSTAGPGTWTGYSYSPIYLDMSGCYAEACVSARTFFDTHQTILAPENPVGAYWNISRGMRVTVYPIAYLSPYFRIQVTGYLGAAEILRGPKLMIESGYKTIPHDVKIWAWWDGTGDYNLWQQFGGITLTAGKNLVFKIDSINKDTEWKAGFENPGNTLHFPPYRTPFWPDPMYNSALTITAAPPIEDWKFNFCKTDDTGGAVTWMP